VLWNVRHRIEPLIAQYEKRLMRAKPGGASKQDDDYRVRP
jgi:hypothetical protein